MKRTLDYVLDTDTCIYLLKGDQHVKARVAQVGIEAIAVAIVTKRRTVISEHTIQARLTQI